MKPENKRTARIIIGSVLIGSALLFTAIVIDLLFSIKDVTATDKGIIITFVSFIDVLFIFLGIRSLVIGAKSYKVMKILFFNNLKLGTRVKRYSPKQGRIKEAKVISITKVNGSPTAVELVVSFYGESGKRYELTVYTCFANVMNIEVGQYIQCYVNGETGYIDVHNIKVVREKEEEIKFE